MYWGMFIAVYIIFTEQIPILGLIYNSYVFSSKNTDLEEYRITGKTDSKRDELYSSESDDEDEGTTAVTKSKLTKGT